MNYTKFVIEKFQKVCSSWLNMIREEAWECCDHWFMVSWNRRVFANICCQHWQDNRAQTLNLHYTEWHQNQTACNLFCLVLWILPLVSQKMPVERTVALCGSDHLRMCVWVIGSQTRSQSSHLYLKVSIHLWSDHTGHMRIPGLNSLSVILRGERRSLQTRRGASQGPPEPL